jgi:single-strand DNA-binding protein
VNIYSGIFRHNAQSDRHAQVKVEQIIDLVCAYYGADRDGVMSRSRLPRWIWPRHVAMAVSAANGFASSTIGDVMQRERSVVSYATKSVLNQCETNPELDNEVREIARKAKKIIIQKMNYNKVILAGRLTAEPNLQLTDDGLDVCDFSMAINRKRKEPESDEVCYIDCTAFRKTAQTIGKHFDKGDPILIEGRLRFNRWGGSSGEAFKKHEIIVERFEFVGGKKSGEPVEVAAPQPTTPSSQPQRDDDVPF